MIPPDGWRSSFYTLSVIFSLKSRPRMHEKCSPEAHDCRISQGGPCSQIPPAVGIFDASVLPSWCLTRSTFWQMWPPPSERLAMAWTSRNACWYFTSRVTPLLCDLIASIAANRGHIQDSVGDNTTDINGLYSEGECCLSGGGGSHSKYGHCFACWSCTS